MEQSLISEINTIREKVILNYYDKAKQELKDKVKINPLKTEFILFESEPIQLDIATEISRRLSINNKCDITINSRFFSSLVSLSIKLPLPLSLLREEIKVEEIKVEEIKVEEIKVEEVKTEETR
jgi:hypothetical protein